MIHHLLPQPGGFEGTISARETLDPDDPSVAKFEEARPDLVDFEFVHPPPHS
jgi:hypothetical protein